jgi:hypothetical protein
MSVAQAICTLQLLVSTALLAKVFAANEKLERVGKPSLCKTSNEAANYNHTCGQISGGVVSNARLLNERCCCLNDIFCQFRLASGCSETARKYWHYSCRIPRN